MGMTVSFSSWWEGAPSTPYDVASGKRRGWRDIGFGEAVDGRDAPHNHRERTANQDVVSALIAETAREAVDWQSERYCRTTGACAWQPP
jgi:hypothetical protein